MSSKSLDQIIFRYSSTLRWFTITTNIAAFLIPVYLVGNFIIRYYAKYNTLSLTVSFPILIYSVFLGLALVITANFYPEIIADKNGLHVQFLWYRLPLSWQDILVIKPSLFNLNKHTTTWVVQTRKLSHFHRLYGLLYSFSLLPSFIIRYEIENREAIVEMIKKRRFVQPK